MGLGLMYDRDLPIPVRSKPHGLYDGRHIGIGGAIDGVSIGSGLADSANDRKPYTQLGQCPLLRNTFNPCHSTEQSNRQFNAPLMPLS